MRRLLPEHEHVELVRQRKEQRERDEHHPERGRNARHREVSEAAYAEVGVAVQRVGPEGDDGVDARGEYAGDGDAREDEGYLRRACALGN